MIRVLHVIGAMDRGGAETMVMNLYRAVDKSRMQFDFLVHEERECDYDQEILDLGGRIYRVPRFTGANLIAYKKDCRRLFAEHPEHRIVHGHIGSSAAIYLKEAKRAGRVAIAHSHAQNYLPGVEGLVFDLIAHPTRNIADWFFACSKEAGIDRFGEKVVEGDRFAILDNGIDVELYRCDEEGHRAAKERLGLAGKPVFGHVGRLSLEKNHEFLFEVFSLLKERIPDAILLLIGRGPLEQELRERADAMGIGDSVKFLGVRDDVPALLKAMDVFVFPSVKEGLAMAAVEAQAAGLPCIVSTGVPEHAVVSDRVRHLPLEDGAASWAQNAWEAYVDAKVKPRADCVEQVRAGGFDIAATSLRLQSFYERLANGEEAVF